MKPNLAYLALLLPLSAAVEAKDVNPAPPAEHNQAQSPAAILAAQVKEISASSSMSRKSQTKLIASAVRAAITAVTDGVKDPAERLKRALELATAAAKAAPQFASTITSTAASLPALATIEGALSQIQTAVNDGVAAADEAAGSSDRPAKSGRPHEKPEFDGPEKGETVVSPSH